jgi:hypothetical protein
VLNRSGVEVAFYRGRGEVGRQETRAAAIIGALMAAITGSERGGVIAAD